MKGAFIPLILLNSKVVADREKVVYMGDVEGSDANVIVGEVNENEAMTLERFFTVGEVVEFWEGAYVSGKRSDSGEPAFVKRVEGNGVYSIKMVGSTRGQFRKAGWKSLFKQGSFNKNVAMGYGSRVRGEKRLKERAKEEEEAKLGVELRATQRELDKKAKEKKQLEKEGEDRLKFQEKQARHAAKNLSNVHKRELAEMRGDLERTRLEEIKMQEDCVRALRQNTRQITRDLEQTQQDLIDKTERSDALDKAVKKGFEKLDGLRENGLRWKSKYTLEKAEVMLRDEKIVAGALERRELGRALERDAKRNGDLVGDLRTRLESAGAQAQVSYFCLLVFLELTVFLHR